MRAWIATALRSPAFWLLLVVFALEFWLFDHFGARRHTPVYPRWNDQIQYLTESYTGYELARARGLVAGLFNALTNPSAQGTLHDFFAIIAFAIAGPSRSAALSLNMLALIAWQLALFVAVRRTGSSRPLALAAALLPLALAGPWQNIPGSAYDFRLDHLAMCALGITTAAALLADGFRSRSGSICFGIAVGLTLLTRFLTGTYFVFVFAAFALWALRGDDRKRKAFNLVGATFIAAAIAAPILWLNFAMMRDYYWIGHYVGPESAIRNSHLGLGRSLAFVARQLGERHLGVFFGLIAIGGALALAFVRHQARESTRRHNRIIGGVFLLAPALVLTLHQQKSAVVVSALVPGAVMLVIAAWRAAGDHASLGAQKIFAGAVTLLVLLYFTHTQIPPAYTPANLAEIRLVNTLADQVLARAQAAGRTELRVAVDHITDCLDAQVLRVISYERHRALPAVNMTLPTGIVEPDESTVMSRLRESDFVFLTDDAAAGPFPFDQKLAALRPQVRAWCEANLRAVDRFTLFGRSMVLYQHPEIPLP